MYVAEDKRDGELYGPFETEFDFEEYLETTGENRKHYKLREVQPL